jgi:hypothetical protein
MCARIQKIERQSNGRQLQQLYELTGCKTNPIYILLNKLKVKEKSAMGK